MLTLEEIQRIIYRCKCKDWKFHIAQRDGGFLLQAEFLAPDAQSGFVERQPTRKWYISAHSCVSEVVNTVLMCVLAAEEHEARENFRYDGEAIYHPHMDVRELAARAKVLDRRADKTMEPSHASP